jgi:hypothetical protein
MLPSVVVYPASTEDVVKIVRIATTYKVPITVYSGATSLEGHYRAVRTVCAYSWPLCAADLTFIANSMPREEFVSI